MNRLILVLSLLTIGACYSEEPGVAVGYSGGVGYGSPQMEYVSPGVQVISDYDYPVFYSDGFYWRYDGGAWYRSGYYNRGWVSRTMFPSACAASVAPRRTCTIAAASTAAIAADTTPVIAVAIAAMRAMAFAAAVLSFAIIARPRRSIAVVAARVPWFAITAVRLVFVACAACAAAPTALVAKKVSGPSHDPDHARGPLPSEAARKSELALVRHDLDAMYAHRLAKLARYQLDEDTIFAAAEQKLLAAASWVSYDTALYGVLAKFRDGHLTYRPPQTAAPKIGYASFRLGLRTVLANDHLLIADVDPISDVAAAGVVAGDEVTSIDGVTVAVIFEREAATRSDARPESALASFAKSWTAVLYPKGDPPRVRKIVVAKRAGGDVTVTITPKPADKVKHEAISIEKVGDIAVVTIRMLEGNKRGDAIDKALSEARAAKGIVVDLRGDRGGVDKVGYRVVAGLAPGKAVVARYRVLVAPETLARRPQWKDLKPEADGFSPEQLTTIDGLGSPYAGKIAIIVDAGCISTCEVVASAVRADSHATVIGEVTGGSSGAPLSVTLPSSRGTIQIPSWNLTTADGKPIEDDGITPDVISVPTADALADHRDAVLEAAIAAAKP